MELGNSSFVHSKSIQVVWPLLVLCWVGSSHCNCAPRTFLVGSLESDLFFCQETPSSVLFSTG